MELQADRPINKEQHQPSIFEGKHKEEQRFRHSEGHKNRTEAFH